MAFLFKILIILILLSAIIVAKSMSFDENKPQRKLSYISESLFDKNSEIINEIEESSSINFKLGSLGGFYTLDEIYSELDKMILQFPDIIQKKLIGNSLEGNPIFVYIFGYNVIQNYNAKVLITALHHSNEPGSVFALIYYLTDLLKRYESGEKLADFILSNRIIYVIPVINPDGVLFNEKNFPQGGGMWRKNRRFNPDSTFGVDLNRNYGPMFAWDAPNHGSSMFGSLETYRGTEPFSEPETQTVRNFVEQEKNIKIAVNLHTYGNAVFYPYSYLTHTNPDSLWYRAFLTENYRQNGYLQGLDVDVIKYPNRGTSDDFMFFGNSKFSPIKSMTCEIGGPVYGFWPPIDTAIIDAKKNLKFFDDVLLSADQNLALADKELLMINNVPILKLTIQNIGLNDVSSFSLTLLSNSDSVFVEDNVKFGYNLKKNNSMDFFFKLTENGIQNGKMTSYDLEIKSNFEKKINFEIPVYEYYEYDLMSNEHINQWSLENTWNFKLNDNNQLILQSNDSLYYGQKVNSIASFKIPDFPFDISRYILRFDHWIELESNYDFGLILAKTINDNKFYNVKLGEFMVRGSNREGGIQFDSLWGYHGAFRFWMPQTVYLNNFEQSKLTEFAFNLRTDNGISKKGWKIKNIKLRVYPKLEKPSTANDVKDDFISITNPVYDLMNVSISDQLLNNVTTISIYNLAGTEILKSKYHNQHLINIDLKKLSAGIYFIKIDEKVFKFIKM